MSSRIGSLLVAGLFLILTTSFSSAQNLAPARPVNFGKRVEILLMQKIVPAYQMGDRVLLLKSLASATSRLNPNQLVAFDERLSSLNMPTAAEMMVSGYMSLIMQGDSANLPPPALKETLVMLPSMLDKIKEVVSDTSDSVATLDPLPQLETLEEYEGLFWDIHVLQNRMRNANRFAQFGTRLIEQSQKRRVRDAESAATLKEVANEFAERVAELQLANRELAERELEFRLDRLALAKRTLGDASKFIEKLQAAFAGQQDLAAFKKIFAAAEPVEFQRDRLLDTNLQENVNLLAEQIDSLSGDLKEQSQLFYQGLHMWLRGRHGSGPDMNGMLKNIRVVKDDRFLFPLFIPENMGKPPFELIRNPEWENSNPDNDDELAAKPYLRVKSGYELLPDYPRRHHYGWMFEYRQKGPQTEKKEKSQVGFKTEKTYTTNKLDKPVFF